jgi:hypothetical protein
MTDAESRSGGWQAGLHGPAGVVGPRVDLDPLASDSVRALALDIAYRLRSVCSHLSEGDLVRLATSMALLEHRYVISSMATQPTRRSSPRTTR